MEPEDAVTNEQLAALQERLESLHGAQLLGDEERDALEDCLADFIDYL